ncbi:hypothetical protein MJO28_002350 [Puccinia striiformis f. sp. tritici]|uniref:Uncharacterized protein n=1 Tax=Puccinia striiformis f. sp. tritici TaxID=168172 RepID=A0ACC0EX61_9BASI|nr:hypothetical protein MJO28_002350 [Puccinia striiformis f. sp. tritici]KAI7966682.1 hypothetical protein MJO29_002430 [Puccinia striiformis f. sp. tritici]
MNRRRIMDANHQKQSGPKQIREGQHPQESKGSEGSADFPGPEKCADDHQLTDQQIQKRG